MNQKKLCQELMTWLPELECGKALEVDDYIGKSVEICDVNDLIIAIKSGHQIRIKQTPIPPAPDGDEWHNPHNLTGEQIGTDQGYRLLLKSEICDRDCPFPGQLWNFNKSDWGSGLNVYGASDLITYRVDAKKYPLGMLRDSSDDKKLDEVHGAIFCYFLENGFPPQYADAAARELTSGKVPHIEIKY